MGLEVLGFSSCGFVLVCPFGFYGLVPMGLFRFSFVG
jgi:hypothetical protein